MSIWYIESDWKSTPGKGVAKMETKWIVTLENEYNENWQAIVFIETDDHEEAAQRAIDNDPNAVGCIHIEIDNEDK